MPQYQNQNIYGEAEGLLKKEVKLEIIDETAKTVRIGFTESTKCRNLQDNYIVKVYFRYRLREHSTDPITYQEFNVDQGIEEIDLSSLGESWKKARWQVKISGIAADDKEKFIYAWTEQTPIEKPKGEITYKGEPIFSIKKEELPQGVSWDLEVRDEIPTMLVSTELESFFDEMKTKTMTSSLMIVEAVRAVLDIIMTDFIQEGNGITATSNWQGKWLELINSECDGVQHPFDRPVGEQSLEFTEVFFEFKKNVAKEFMRKSEQFDMIISHYRELNAVGEEGA